MLHQRINVCFGEAASQRAGPTRAYFLAVRVTLQSTLSAYSVEKHRFWQSRRNFCPYSATSFLKRRVRPNWPSAAHVPARCASWQISSDFRVSRVLSEKSRHPKFGVFQHNLRTADLGAQRSMGASVCYGLNGSFCNSCTDTSQTQLRSGFRPS